MLSRVKISERDAQERNKDFKQVNAGYTREQMLEESKRCLQCKTPLCRRGCPVEIDIPDFIRELSLDNPGSAIEILKKKNNLPAVCGRVCPQENQCEKFCILGKKGESVAIGNLERYAADWAAANNKEKKRLETQTNAVKIAVIGAGPAGLTCAGDLCKLGYEITVFESLHDTGGVLRYGIPEFRLPSEVLDAEIEALKENGIKFVLNTLIGRTKTLADLFDEGYKAVFAGTGAGLPVFLGIEGENLNNVYSANEFLVRVNLMRSFDFPHYDTPVYKGKKVVVIGGGNTAMDSARTALRLGAQSVKLVYRRTETEMPARKEERIHAKEEGVEFVILTSPVRFIGDDKKFLKGVECVKMQLGQPDESGRRRAFEIKDSNFIIEADMAVLALGLNPNPILPSLTPGLKTDGHGYLIIDENFMTSIPGLFAGGDIAGGDTVIQAMGMGKQAAKKMDEYVRNLK
ncbi:MAG: NADPH-dependent glutamate synthase [Endomicrobium sp.]|jgi:glutamate synthase (NADPH/NADH) small chain|nr:NADPH-dependent glutamate synthase [Endomicrobium sp.]